MQLSFNSGEYSPFLDSRIDIEKSASAARQLENMQCTLAGEAKRRPGLRFVARIREGICNLTFTTYEGSGTWCGFKGFFTFNDGVTPRYLTKTVKGFQQYVNGEFVQTEYPNWSDEKDEILSQIDTLVSDDDAWTVDDIPPPENPSTRAGYLGVSAIESAWYGSASYDPEDGCSLANGIHVWRRTNGWQYAVLMSYVTGPSTSDEILDDVDDVFSGPYPGESQVVIASNTISTPSPNERISKAFGFTTLGNQLGSHTVIGTVREILGSEHTLYDQLVLDGAEVTSTRTSELTVFDDDTGSYEGQISSFSFVVSDTLNQSGVRYVVEFSVTRTTGSVSESLSLSEYYVGDGTSGRTISVVIPPADVGTSTEFNGECVTVRRDVSGFFSFDAMTDSEFAATTDSEERWQTNGRFVCGIGGSSIGGYSFEELPDSSGNDALIDTEVGHCFGDGLLFSPFEPIGWHEFENLADGNLNLTPGSVGFVGIGKLFITDNKTGRFLFETLADGTYTTTAGGTGFAGQGVFVEDFQQFGIFEFEAIADGAVSTTPVENGFASAGNLFVVDP